MLCVYHCGMENNTLINLYDRLKQSGTDIHIDTLYKSARRRQASIKLAEMLEGATGISRSLWIWPNENGVSPWDL